VLSGRAAPRAAGRGEWITARGVVLACALGINRLLAGCRHRGSLPRVSGRLGQPAAAAAL